MVRFSILREGGEFLLGYIPTFLSEHDPLPAREQLDANYKHGGGWNPMAGWKMGPEYSIKYPGDPWLYPVAKLQLRDEIILVYEHAWVVVLQPDGSFEIARMD